MSFADFQERLSRSIKVINLPRDYSKDDILSNLKNAGNIEETKLGANEMIVTYSNANEKDLSKMYDGCPIGDYIIKLEDPISFDVLTVEMIEAKEKAEKIQKEAEAKAKLKPKVVEPEPTFNRPSYSVNPQPNTAQRTESTTSEKVASAGLVKPEIQRVEQAAVVERKEENVPGRMSDSSSDLLRDLQNINLPARSGLPSNDSFNVVTRRSYLLIFTTVWALQLFVRSLF